ncbi:leucine-rich repeat-containing protein 37A3-like [Grammomys surdaster]|uniref:leucine-rich repeat-containing protein 37A3-like n=1 Tax=Grammomys surdaster TaxID=491861 RepID=UPI0010A07AEA|nr:leucine-rich repeat-containing protein 37A3-like [Grammomys surdaster]
MSPLHFGARRLLFTWQLLWLLAPAVPIPEFTGNPVQLTSEPWMPTKVWSWHPSDHPPKAAHTRISKTDIGAVDYLGSSVSREMLSPLEELTDSLLPFQDPSTFRKLNPESEELVPHKDLTNKLIPTGKQPGNILTLSGDQNQAPTLPEFKSTASLVGAADNQLYEIVVPPLDSQSSKATTFIVSPKNLKKDLAQHKKLAKVVVGKLQVQKQIMDDYYEDLTMNEPHSYNLPLQSQEKADEAPELLEQVELNQMETQTRNPETIKEVESSPYEEETPTQTPGPLVGAELFLNQQQQQPAEPSEESESPGIYLESSVQPQEDSEEVGPLPTQQEDLSQHLGPVLEDESSLSELEQPIQLSESPEEVGSGSENQPGASVQPTVFPLVEQEAPFGAPESPIETVAETSPIHEIQPTQNEDYRYHLPNVTVRPVAVTLTITLEPIKEIDSFLAQQEFPVHALEYSDYIEPFLKEEEPPAQASETPGESQFESQLEVPVQASEYGEEFKSSTTEQPAQFPENHEVTVLPSNHYQAQHSSLSDVTGQPSDLDITITENPIEMGTSPVYHDAAAAPEEVEFLTNQQGVLSQSLEPILYDKPLSQQEDTTGISQISEEGEPFPSQQESPKHSLELPTEEIAQPPGHHEHVETQQPNSAKTTVQPLDLELAINLQPTKENFAQTLQETTPQVHTQHSNTTEATVQPLDLELTITPQPTAEGELPQTLQDSTTQIIEPPTMLVVPVPVYQEVIVQTPSQDQAEYLPSPTVTFQPLDLELTITPEATRESHHPTVPQQTIIVHPPKHPLVIHSEQVQHPNPTEGTVKPSDLELTITPQPTAEGELPQTLQDSTSQIIIEPPIEVIALVPVYQEVTVQTPSQDQAEYPTSPTVSSQPLDLELTITPEATRESHHPTVPQQTIIVYPPKHPLVIHSEQVHTQPPNPTEATVQSSDLELTVTPQPTAEGDVPQTLQDSTTQITEPSSAVVIPVPVYLEVTVPTLSQDQAEYPNLPTVSFQPLDLELTITPEPTKEAEYFTTPKKTSAFLPSYTHMTLPQQVPVQHLKPTKGIVQPLDLELTITPQPTTEGELSQTVQESTSQIAEPHKEIVVPAPVYQEVTVPSPSQDQAEYQTSLQPLDLELTITSEPTKEADHSTISKKTITVHFPKRPLVIYPEHFQTQHLNIAETTDQPLDLELTINSEPTREADHTIPDEAMNLPLDQ